jgi:hypothetical protein
MIVIMAYFTRKNASAVKAEAASLREYLVKVG